MAITSIPFAVASDEAISKAYSRQRLLNLYAETSPTKAKSAVLIVGRPGLKSWETAGSGPLRGEHVMGGTLYVVSGMNLYSVSSAGIATLIGTVSGTGFVVMADNGSQLCIATNGAWVDELDGYFLWGQKDSGGAGYLYNATSGSFGQIASSDFLLPNSGKFQISAIDDGSSYDALDFATAESSPDDLIRGYVDRRDVMLFGEKSVELWFDSGAADFPFERQNQTVIPKGIVGYNLVTSIDNSVFWLGTDPLAGGTPVVYRLTNYDGQRVSTHAVEAAIADVSDWSTSCLIGFIVNGHAFLSLVIPDRAAWVYDCATGLWHEEETYGLGRWRGNCHAWCYGKHLIGSCDSGDIFALDETHYFDGSDTPLVAEMVSVPIGDDITYKTMGRFQLDMETGVGLTSGQGSDPQIMLQYSDDRGRTWSNEKWRSAGKIGNYGLAVIWRQLGRFRSRVLRLRMTDPVKRAFLAYFADIT